MNLPSMNISPQFHWRTEQRNGLEFIVLRCETPAQNITSREAWIAPSRGSNLCRFSVGNQHIIDFEQELLLKYDFTGTPVLYPTPNRVRNGIFRYHGKNFVQSKKNVMIYEHGLVHNESWNYQEPVVSSSSVTLKTWIDFNKFSAAFDAFPFIHRLALEFCLTETGIKIAYTIENQDEQAIPFGFGLHPYFNRLCGDQGTFIELPADSIMDYTSDLLPTGKLIAVDHTIFDLRNKTNIGMLDLDHVFTGVTNGKYAQVIYSDLGLRVQLLTTDDFSHLVLYSPRGAGFFCLENQTCSTDAHNLYERGFKTESGLKLVPVGKVHTGSVTYLIIKE